MPPELFFTSPVEPVFSGLLRSIIFYKESFSNGFLRVFYRIFKYFRLVRIQSDAFINLKRKRRNLSNWPMLYILENGKQTYIGQSNHVINRMSQHYHSIDKRIFDKVHFIYSPKFNQSVTFDYESKLIQYLVADELYEIRNKNAGMADKEYYRKKEYDEKFHVLWRSLQKSKLVKHSLEELENSDLKIVTDFKKFNQIMYRKDF